MNFEIFTLNIPMGNSAENVVLDVKVIDEENNVLLFSHNELFDDNLLEMLLQQNIVLKVKAINGTNPYIITQNLSDPRTVKCVKNIKPVLETLMKISKMEPITESNKLLPELSKVLSQKFGSPFSVEDLVKIYNSYIDLQGYFKNSISLDLSRVGQAFLTLDSNKSVLDKYKLNAKIKDLWFLDEKINQTLVQEHPEDKLFMRLPDYESLTTRDSSAGLVEDLQNMIQPYKAEAAKYSHLPSDKRPSDLLRTPNYASYVLKGDPSYDIKNVIGNTSNNDLPIQPNEEEFYRALCSLCDFTEKKKNPDDYNNISAVDDLSTPFFPTLNIDFKDFIINIIAKALQINYAHTAFVPVTVDKEIDEDDDSDNTAIATSSVDSSYAFYYSDKNPGQQLASDIVLNYIESETGDPHALCEAAVKLLRWGSRKPTKLKVSGAKTYLSLDTFREESTSGSFDTMELQLADGCALRPTPVKLALNANFADRDFIRTLGFSPQRFGIPVGITTYKQYLSSGNEALVQTIHMSLIDLVYNLLTGVSTANDKVYGYSYNTTTKRIEVKEEVLANLTKNVNVEQAVIQTTTSTEGTVEFYQPGIVKDIFLKYNVWNATRCSVLSQINKYKDSNDLKVLNEYYSTNESELISLAQEGVLPAEALTINMFRQVLNVLCYVNDKVNLDLDRGIESSFVDILNYYADAIVEYKFNYGSFTDTEVISVENKLEDMMAGGNNTTINQLDTFGSNNDEDDLDEDMEDEKESFSGGWIMNNFIEPVPAGVDAFRLYMNVLVPNKEGIIDPNTNKVKLVPGKKVISAVHQIVENGEPRYIILGFEDREKYNLVSNKNPIPGLRNMSVDEIPELFTDMISCALNNDNFTNCKVKFASKEALLEVVKRYVTFSKMR